MLITIGFTSETIFYLLLTPRVPGPRQPQVQGSIKLCGEVTQQFDNQFIKLIPEGLARNSLHSSKVSQWFTDFLSTTL